jgi:hypothetical protein
VVGGRIIVMKKLINIGFIVLVILLAINANKIFSYTYNSFYNLSTNKLLCVPNSEKRDYNIKTFKYVKKHFSPHEIDILISVEENKLTIHRDSGNEDYPRVKINADPSTFLMGFYKKGFKHGSGFTFHRKSGRLIYYLEGGLYGIDEDIKTETYYVCSKFKKNLF